MKDEIEKGTKAMTQKFFERAKAIAGSALVVLGILVFSRELSDAAINLHCLLTSGLACTLPTILLAGFDAWQNFAASHQRFCLYFVEHLFASSWPLLAVTVGAGLFRTENRA